LSSNSPYKGALSLKQTGETSGKMGSQQAVDSSHYLPRIVCFGNIKAGLLTYGSEQKRLPKNKHCVYFQWLKSLYFPITVTRIVPESHGIPCSSAQENNNRLLAKNTLNLESKPSQINWQVK
jgi:hypothetical protein